MFNHKAMQQTIALVGIDLCFSGIQQQHHYPIISIMKANIGYADLENADWYWARYGDWSHIVAMHEPAQIPEFLLGDFEDKIMDLGMGIAAFMRMINGSASALCEGMEFHFPDRPIVHAPNMLHRI